MEDWVLDELEKIRPYGKFTKNEIKKLKIVEGTTPKGEEARYVDVCIDVITKHKKVCGPTIKSPYSTVEYDKDEEITSIKIWFHKEKNELLRVEEISYEYDSSEEMWNFYSEVYKDVFKDIQESTLIEKLKNRSKDKFYRCYKRIADIQFGGEVDFNFSTEGKKTQIAYFKKVVRGDEVCEEPLKEKISVLLDIVAKRHHSIENVSIMPSNGNMQFTKKSIGNDRFDVMVLAVDEYCKGNTALLLAHCTPEYQKTLKEFIHLICFDSEQNALNSRFYFEKIYNINDDDLIQNLLESGKKAIDSAQRVLEYIALAYRVWICRSNNYNSVAIYDKNRISDLSTEYDSVKNCLNQ